MPDRPTDCHDRLIELLADRSIGVAELAERTWKLYVEAGSPCGETREGGPGGSNASPGYRSHTMLKKRQNDITSRFRRQA